MPESRPQQSRRAPRVGLIVIPGEPGRKYNHLGLMTHRGGGWYDVACMGEGKRCKAGECKHTANLGWAKPGGKPRPLRQVPRD